MRLKPVEIGKKRFRVAPRIKPRTVLAKMRTFGTSLEFKMDVEDVSLSGFLFSRQATLTVPFNVKTLVEIDLDLEFKDKVVRRLTFVGKVVRKAPEVERDGKRVGFGVQIIQMDEVSDSLWRRYMKEELSEILLDVA